MRKFLLLAVTGALLVAMAAGTATAKGPSIGKSKSKGPATVTYVFEGKIAPSNEDGAPFVITEIQGKNKVAREAVKSGPLIFTIVTGASANQEATEVELDGQEATLADLQAGDKIVVQAKAPKGVTSFTVEKISAERPEAPTEPTESAPADGEPSS